MTFSIKLENKFKTVPRDIQVRRKNRGKNLDEHQVSSPARDVEKERTAVNFSLGAVDLAEDYLEISVVDDEQQQQHDLGPCKIDLRKNVPFRFIPGGTESITVKMVKHLEKGKTITSLKIPLGPPTWKLEIMRPPEPGSEEGDAEPGLIDREGSLPDVTVGDEEPGGWD